MDARRLFVGLKPPPEAGEALAAAARAVLPGRDFRRTAGPDVHLTLCFLGAVPEAARPALEAALHSELAGAPGVRGRLAGSGAFPRRGRERVLWAGLALEPAERERLLDLVRRAERAARAAGLACAPREPDAIFVPHLTLARPRPGARVPDAFYALDLDVPWRAEAVALCESVRAAGPEGRYPALALVPLAPA